MGGRGAAQGAGSGAGGRGARGHGGELPEPAASPDLSLAVAYATPQCRLTWTWLHSCFAHGPVFLMPHAVLSLCPAAWSLEQRNYRTLLTMVARWQLLVPVCICYNPSNDVFGHGCLINAL